MNKLRIRLAAASITTATMLLTPVVATAQPANEQAMSRTTEHKAMANHHKSGSSSATGTNTTASQPNMAAMSMSGTNAMMRTMRGHATMADAMRARPELEKMCQAMMSMTGTNAMADKMRGHATMADAMRAHPELEKMCQAMMTQSSAMMKKMRGHATTADAMRAHPELAPMG